MRPRTKKEKVVIDRRVKEAPLKACNTRQLHFKPVLTKEDFDFISLINKEGIDIGKRKYLPTLKIFDKYTVPGAKDFERIYVKYMNGVMDVRTHTFLPSVRNNQAPFNTIIKKIYRKALAKAIISNLRRLSRIGIGIFIEPKKSEDKKIESLREILGSLVTSWYYDYNYKDDDELEYLLTSGFILNGEHPDDVFKCSKCLKETRSNEIFTYRDEIFKANKKFCIECFVSEFSVCHKCGKVEKIDTMRDEPIETEPETQKYCGTCYDDIFSTCVHCGVVYDSDSDGGVVSGEDVCGACYESASICDACGDRFWDGDMAGDVCTSCDENREMENFTCTYCGQEYNDDYRTEYDDVCTKCECLEEISDIVVDSELSDSEALATVPNLNARIDKMFETSASLRSVDLGISRDYLRDKFKNLKFDFTNLLIYTPDGREFKLSYLARNSPLTKNMTDAEKSALRAHAEKFYNTREYNLKASTSIKRFALNWLPKAIQARIILEKNYPDAKKLTDELQGVYKYDDEVSFVFTKDPVDLLSKTTSTCWESFSCEKIKEGVWGMGSFSDISNLGMVVFIVNKKGLKIARLVLRWCLTEGEVVKIGLESKWYYCKEDPETTSLHFKDLGTSALRNSGAEFIYKALNTKSATEFVEDILSAKHALIGKNNTCKTPYHVGGYSDTHTRGHTKVLFRG